jgi:hypothetical protein
MAILNPVVSVKRPPAFSQAFDTVLTTSGYQDHIIIIIIIIIIVSLITGDFSLVHLLLKQCWSPPLKLHVSDCSTFRVRFQVLLLLLLLLLLTIIVKIIVVITT